MHASCTCPKHENEEAMALKAFSHPSPLIITQPTAKRERERDEKRIKKKKKKAFVFLGAKRHRSNFKVKNLSILYILP